MDDPVEKARREKAAESLSTVTLDDILDEIGRRYRSYILAVEGATKKAADDRSMYALYYGGGGMTALGLANYAMVTMQNAVTQSVSDA